MWGEYNTPREYCVYLLCKLTVSVYQHDVTRIAAPPVGKCDSLYQLFNSPYEIIYMEYI